MTKRVVLYGSGRRCKTLCRILQISSVEIVAVIDSNPNKWGTEIEGINIESPEGILKYQDVDVCITIADRIVVNSIRRNLQQMYQFGMEREIHYNKLILEAYKDSFELRNKISEFAVNGNRKESILFDCYNGLGLGGVEAWTIDICQAFIDNEKGNTYIISDKGEYNIPSKIEKHILAADINHKERFIPTSISNLMEVIIKKLPCIVVTCTTDEVMLAAYIIKTYYPDMIKIVSVIHNSNESVYEAYMDFRECSDLYICVSQDIRFDMLHKGIDSKKIYSMTCPFPCDEILDRTYTEDKSLPIRIAYAGRMDGMEHSQKRMDLLLKLIELLVEKKVFFKMELAGDGPARKEMEEFVSKNHLNEKVQFMGRLERFEMPFFWRRQDICINLADYEGRSIGIIEAMGNGSIPIVTKTSGVKEDITDGINGYIVPIGDYCSMADRIRDLAENRERLHEMGMLAHDMVYPKSLMEPHFKFWEKILFHRL